MTAVWYLWRIELRSRWRRWLLVALLAGLPAGAALATIATARRTATAIPRFFEATRAYDGWVGTPPVEGAFADLAGVAKLPQVAVAARASVPLILGGRTSSGVTIHYGDYAPFASVDGRYGDVVDQPRITAGRATAPERPGRGRAQRARRPPAPARAGRRR